MSDQAWERAALREILDEALRERRRNRLWRIITRIALVVAILVLAISITQCAMTTDKEEVGPHTAEVRINEPIMSDSASSADNVIKGLNAAFEADDVAGVVLRINTPGGSPVHSQRIYDEIKRLRDEHPDIPVHAVIDDIGVSGGYFVAAAADKIHVGGSSVVGSIGVIAGSFGAEEALEKLGLERRVHTAGEDKAFLDPFSPLRDDHVEHLRLMLEDMHQQFIDAVREGRGERLDEENNEDLFSGLVWTGAQSIELGLADEIGSVSSVARDVIGEEEVVDYTAKRDFFTELSEQFGISVGQGLYYTLKRLEYQVH
ncbi:S49 family peptidase [Halorhodospira halochloris]|uniref:Periplasmic serine proteases n=1 Tax=Halorhodospira halochloris TaxID=1052 RepID=A0A0X8XCF5_HALHR|nr:S49 family peptidase [Halorhodospira halochloris]MBK1652092.1 S49 family peptidase [Halorhodospira halochloris]MCG5530774.1 S49 family peptidase [Halorhodospira halochloris]MCG5549040.1 S49 family peptidase [Halorhodospira halochloris]BAU58014.1 periplasmic serine proteases [Halorhodospira halochloris]